MKIFNDSTVESRNGGQLLYFKNLKTEAFPVCFINTRIKQSLVQGQPNLQLFHHLYWLLFSTIFALLVRIIIIMIIIIIIIIMITMIILMIMIILSWCKITYPK